MRSTCVIALLLLAATFAAAGRIEPTELRPALRPAVTVQNVMCQSAPDRASDTLWIFDADFEDMVGDNAGWTSHDMTGRPASENYWGVDTIRTPLSRPYLGDHTWWCGTYALNDCWAQTRGYGNRWTCALERDFPEVDANTIPSDELQLEWDQRYAIERWYDYAYVDVSTDGGTSWTTLATYTNGGFSGGGIPMNWGGTSGHPVLDMNDYAGAPILRMRFRFESETVESSYDASSLSFKDGAWQIDNVKWSKRQHGVEHWTPFWLDDCETGGDPAWVREPAPPAGQTASFVRTQYPNEIQENFPRICGHPPDGSWVMAAVDPVTDRMLDGENAWLLSPPIDVSGVSEVVVNEHLWVDCYFEAHDYFNLYVRTDETTGCMTDYQGWTDEEPGPWYGGPFWLERSYHLDVELPNNWLGIAWRLWNDTPAPNPEDHHGGLFVDRLRVGIPLGLKAGEPVKLFHDWFNNELAQAALDTAWVHFDVPAGISTAELVVPSLGMTFPAVEDPPGSGDIRVAPPPQLLVPGAENLYYFEVVDLNGKSGTCPGNAPEACFEFSILPRGGDVLIVDKAGHLVAGENEDYLHDVAYYYQEALEILGYTWDRYDAPSAHCGAVADSNGPGFESLRHYDMVYWVTGDESYKILTKDDADALQQSLEESEDRNLLLAGNHFSYLTSPARDLLEDCAGVQFWDWITDLYASVYGVGSWDFPEGPLLAECPDAMTFDVIRPWPGSTDTEIAAVYVSEGDVYPAAVVRTDPNDGYEVTTLGFGIEYMAAESGGRAEGIANRVAIIGEAMERMGVEPSGPGTGIAELEARDALSLAHPNPFNPMTAVDYSVASAGRVVVGVYDLSGRLVRTLLDADVQAGASGQLLWDGADEARTHCASGVYFCKVQAPGFEATRKLVLLK